MGKPMIQRAKIITCFLGMWLSLRVGGFAAILANGSALFGSDPLLAAKEV
jgi:hypothetical protein